MRKKLIFILLGLLMLGTIGFFYANNIFLPVKIKKIAENRLSQQLQREVTIENLTMHLFKGFRLQNILIREKENRTKVFARIDEISFKILYTPFFKEKAIIIPSIHIKKPYIHTIKTNNTLWNFSDMLTKSDSTTSLKYKILVRKIIIDDGSLDFKDIPKSFSETFRHVKLQATAHADKTFHFSLSTQIPIENTDLSMKGKFILENRRLQAEIKTKNLNLVKYFSIINPNENIQLHDGLLHESKFDLIVENKKWNIEGMLLTNNLDIQLGVSKRIKGNIHLNGLSLTSSNGEIEASSEVLLPSAELIINEHKRVLGSIKANLKNILLFEKKASLEGDIQMKDMKIFIDNIAEFKGDVTAQNTNFSYTHDDIQAQTQLTITNGSLVYNKVHQASFNSNSRDFNLSYKNGSVVIRGDLELENPSYHFPQGLWKSQRLNTDTLDLNFINDTIKIKSQFQGKESTLTLSSGISFTDNIFIDVNYLYIPKAETPIDFYGTIDFQNGRLTKLPKINQAYNLNGQLQYKNNNLVTKDLKFNTLNADWTLIGNLLFNKEIEVNTEIQTNHIFLEELTPFFKNQLEQFDLELSGPTALKTSYKGVLKKDTKPEIKITANLKDVTAFHPKIQMPFSNLNGRFHYENDLIQWSKLKGVWLNEQVTINGNIANFSRPVLMSTLDSNRLHLKTEANILKNLLQIKQFEGNLFSSEFDLEGDVFFEEKGARVFLKGNSYIDTKDLPLLLPQYRTTWENLALDGVLSTLITFRGHPKYWRDWSLNIAASAPVLKVQNYELEDVQLNYGQRDQNISDADIKANVYGGKLIVNSAYNLMGRNILLDGELNIFDINLEEYIRKTGTRKKLKGKLNLASNIKGPILNPDLLTGSGKVSVSNGELYHLNILEGLKSVILIDEFKNTTFTDGQADFKIANQKFSTTNATMFSPTINLLGKGWIGFDGRVNFEVFPKFSEIALMRSESLRKGPTALLTHTVNVKITGSLNRPIYDVNSAPLNIIKGAPSFIKEGIGAILDEMF